MKKTRRRYDREFKISVVAELESGKPLAQIAREYNVHPALPSRWRDELTEKGGCVMRALMPSHILGWSALYSFSKYSKIRQ